MNQKEQLLNDDEMAAFIDGWIKAFTADLGSTWPNRDASESIYRARILDGFSKHMGPMEIMDYFYISSPGILANAIKNEDEQENAALLFEEVMSSLTETK